VKASGCEVELVKEPLHQPGGLRFTGTGREFVTRGYANGAADPEPITPEQVRGRVWYSVPKVGWLAVWLGDRPLRSALNLLAVGLVLYGAGLVVVGALQRRRGRPGTVVPDV
jgi:signal peptidase